MKQQRAMMEHKELLKEIIDIPLWRNYRHIKSKFFTTSFFVNTPPTTNETTTMTKKRKAEIKKEVERRVKLWLDNASVEEMTFYGSFIRFNMSLGMISYPFRKREWMKEKDFNRFITDEEFDSQEYDEIVYPIFQKLMSSEV